MCAFEQCDQECVNLTQCSCWFRNAKAIDTTKLKTTSCEMVDKPVSRTPILLLLSVMLVIGTNRVACTGEPTLLSTWCFGGNHLYHVWLCVANLDVCFIHSYLEFYLKYQLIISGNCYSVPYGEHFVQKTSAMPACLCRFAKPVVMTKTCNLF